MFEAVAEYLEARGALLRGGTIVDATLIAASPSTKNEAGKRDPQMHSSKKCNQWYFGMKAHVGVDAISELVHTARRDARQLARCVADGPFDPRCRHRGLWRQGLREWREEARRGGGGRALGVKEKAKPGGRLTARQRARNHSFGKVRAKVEHVFLVVKCQFRYRKCAIVASPTTEPSVLVVGAPKPVSRPQDTSVRLTTLGHPLPPAAVS